MNWHQISVMNVFELYYPKRRATKKGLFYGQRYRIDKQKYLFISEH